MSIVIVIVLAAAAAAAAAAAGSVPCAALPLVPCALAASSGMASAQQ